MESTKADERDMVHSVTAQKAWQVFEAQCQRLLGMSAEEFVQRYDSGYWPDPDAVGSVIYLASVRKFAE